jgi:hypothetical protein
VWWEVCWCCQVGRERGKVRKSDYEVMKFNGTAVCESLELSLY